ncbi:hypothetical protein C0R01_02015 [Streptomyces albidoflavus]|nr:hypothetical protein C0Q98_02105 [Streptomyces albidoflavus]RZE69163.1 hypothetical protein C0R00_02390 [Streptomyces albidoflavus]RZE85507.1 hypothetical protein C0R01_02015 [Streptomyces albidoflavus]
MRAPGRVVGLGGLGLPDAARQPFATCGFPSSLATPSHFSSRDARHIPLIGRTVLTVAHMFGPARRLALALFAATPWSVDDALCRS